MWLSHDPHSPPEGDDQAHCQRAENARVQILAVLLSLRVCGSPAPSFHTSILIFLNRLRTKAQNVAMRIKATREKAWVPQVVSWLQNPWSSENKAWLINRATGVLYFSPLVKRVGRKFLGSRTGGKTERRGSSVELDTGVGPAHRSSFWNALWMRQKESKDCLRRASQICWLLNSERNI